mmetsp:Transcript_37239/g.105060  ORF Transcript_37239/g.105060 Transcript_37239/m.105060 type:complete len:291 (-) Transcript_37239:2300-3172(-)
MGPWKRGQLGRLGLQPWQQLQPASAWQPRLHSGAGPRSCHGSHEPAQPADGVRAPPARQLCRADRWQWPRQLWAARELWADAQLQSAGGRGRGSRCRCLLSLRLSWGAAVDARVRRLPGREPPQPQPPRGLPPPPTAPAPPHPCLLWLPHRLPGCCYDADHAQLLQLPPAARLGAPPWHPPAAAGWGGACRPCGGCRRSGWPPAPRLAPFKLRQCRGGGRCPRLCSPRRRWGHGPQPAAVPGLLELWAPGHPQLVPWHGHHPATPPLHAGHDVAVCPERCLACRRHGNAE